MTKKLESLFNLPSIPDDDPDEIVHDIEMTKHQLEDAKQLMDRIDNALPQVDDLDYIADKELDDLADIAKRKFEDIMDLGFNVEAKFSAPIFQVASNLLGHAISAKNSKIDKKLKMVDLQLKKLRIEQQGKRHAAVDVETNTIDGQAVVLDRNELLKQILGKA